MSDFKTDILYAIVLIMAWLNVWMEAKWLFVATLIGFAALIASHLVRRRAIRKP